MRLKLMITAAAAAGALALPAVAQDAQYREALQTMITQTAAGSCPADVMGEALLAACEQQLPQMSAGLASLGAIESITFVRSEERPEGRLEIYTVKFSSGQSLNWAIGGFADGKFNVAFTGG
jgi:hypothetical protein